MKKTFLATVLATSITTLVVGAAIAQGGMGGMMQGGGMGSGMGQGGGMGSGMGQGGVDYGRTRGRMGYGMMQGSVDCARTGGRMGFGKRTLFGSRVVPTMNLSVDDVRNYLSLRLDRLNNKRLKLGEVKADDRTITADVVTVDNSLVQRLKVDRHTGDIDYED